jgi:hypothetical protein
MVCALAGAAMAAPYDFNGTLVEVDYWADDGSPSPENTAIIVIDWNAANGPYATESHAWGYQWTGAEMVLDALNAIDTAGALNLNVSGGGFVDSAAYTDLGIDADVHTTTFDDWAWIGGSTDGGASWIGNGGGVNVEPLVDGGFELINYNRMDWTPNNATIPVPEPTSIALLTIASIGLFQRRRG